MTTPTRSIIGATLVAILVGTGACSSSSDGSTGGTGGTGNSCTITLSGGLSGSPGCTPLGTFWTSDDSMTAFGFLPDFSDPATLVTISLPGEPSKKTYHETDTGIGAAISVTSGSSQWAMQTADGGTPASGTFTMTVTAVNTITSSADGKTYQLHGTLTATLVAIAGTDATGTVTLKATF